MDDSIIAVLQSKFCEVHSKYLECNPSIVTDPMDNLMTSCLNHLIPFCCWARKNDQTSEWIHSTLLGKPDLRPEVRNGIALIIIYTFASARARDGADMFSILQDQETGLGIVNKTSVKVYNDPFNYFEFIKCCLSGLIIAHAIPENERQNKPKKQKSAESCQQNVEEIDAYYELSKQLIDLLASGRRDIARQYINKILVIWHNNKRLMRECRFSSAISAVLSGAGEGVAEIPLYPPPPTRVTTGSGSGGYTFGDMDEDDPDVDLLMGFGDQTAGYALPVMGRNHSLDLDFLENDEPSSKRARGEDSDPPQLLSSSGSHHSLSATTIRTVASSHQEFGDPPKLLKAPSSSSSKMPPHFHPPLQVMRLVRVSDKAWAVTVNKVYHLQKVLSHVYSDMFLVDEKMFSPDEWRNMQLSRRIVTGNACIEAELTSRDMLVAQWSKKDHEQLLHLVSSWTHTINEKYPRGERGGGGAPSETSSVVSGNASPSSSSGDGGVPSLIAFWCVGALSMPCRLNSFGALAYEEVAREGIVVRANEAMGLTEDVWNLHYVQDFARTTSEKESFAHLLISFFPQLGRLIVSSATESAPVGDGPSLRADQVVVKYACHKGETLENESGVTHVPDRLNPAAYQTLGLLNSSADVIPSSATGCFHDIVLVPM